MLSAYKNVGSYKGEDASANYFTTNLGARDLPGPLFKKNTKNGTILHTIYPACYLRHFNYNNYDNIYDILSNKKRQTTNQN